MGEQSRTLIMRRNDPKSGYIQSHTSDQNINVLQSSPNGSIPEQSKTSQGENNANKIEHFTTIRSPYIK